jgi:hypothetical protein
MVQCGDRDEQSSNKRGPETEWVTEFKLMIRSVLVPMLEERFPGRGLRTGMPPDPVAVIPGVHPAVGDVSIWDDGDEATVSVGEITHGHLRSYDSSLSPVESEQEVAAQVLGFLDELFADRVMLWKSPGGSGGWRIVGWAEDLPALDSDIQMFLWSGPIQDP